MSVDAQMFLSPNFLPIFINEYRNHHCLWRVKCKEYSNRNLKQKAYLDLVELCRTVIPDCNIEFVKKKIDLIRGNFRREHRKVIDSKRSGAGTDSLHVHVPKLWYYKLLFFLSDQEQVHQSSLHPDKILQLTASNHAEGDELNVYHDEEADDAPCRNDRKRKATDPTKELVKLTSQRCSHEPQDDIDKIAAAWAAELRKMDPQQQLFAKKAINDIIFEGQMGTLHRNSVEINVPRVYTP